MSVFPSIRLGSKGHYVRLLQADLNGLALNYNGFALDGYFDQKTSDAVKNFQDRFSLNRDGIVRNSTWKVLVDNVLAVQKLLNQNGYHAGHADGWFGAATTAAVIAFQRAHGIYPSGIVDPRTRQALFNPHDKDHYQDRPTSAALESLNLHVAAMARRFLALTREHHMDVRIYTAFRSWSDEDRLFAQGRWTPGPIVTNARGGDSYHNWGLAFDAAPFENGAMTTDVSKFRLMGQLGKQAGLQWGGDFKSIVDYPHFQDTFGLNTWDLLNGVRPPGE